MHLNDEQIQRLLHQELAPREEDSVRAHLGECEECRAHLAGMERDEAEIHALLGGLDHPLPPADARAVAERAVLREREIGSGLRRAALILLGVGIVGAAYAVPGSPLRAWVNAAVERLGAGERVRDGEESTAATPPAEGDAAVHGSGVAMVPGDRFVIEFSHAKSGNRVTVTPATGKEVVVRGPSGAATYSSGADRIDVEIREEVAEFDIQIPGSAPHVEIHADGARLFLKDGARVSTLVPEGPSSSYRFPLSPDDSAR